MNNLFMQLASLKIMGKLVYNLDRKLTVMTAIQSYYVLSMIPDMGA